MGESEHHSIKSKLNGNELDVSGPADFVKQVWQDFHEAASKTQASAPPPLKVARVPPAPGSDDDSGSEIAPATDDEFPPVNGPIISEATLNRVFRRDGDSLSLLALPRTDDPDADALVALVYGYGHLFNRQNITGVALMQAARQSGVNLVRADKALHRRREFIMAAGARRGRRYSLNNRGTQFATELVKGMVE